MDDFDRIIAQLENSHIASSWRSLLALYSEIDQYASAFTQEYHISCPQGCGTCCENFLPDITQIEGSLIAAYLLFIKKDQPLIQKVAQSHDSRQCPFYEKNDPNHCQIYPVRALICRMFSSIPSKDKYGAPQFRKCKYNDKENQFVRIDKFSPGEKIKTMGDFSSQFYSIALDTNEEEIGEVVRHSIENLQFIAAYIESTKERGPYDRPDPLAS